MSETQLSDLPGVNRVLCVSKAVRQSFNWGPLDVWLFEVLEGPARGVRVYYVPPTIYHTGQKQVEPVAGYVYAAFTKEKKLSNGRVARMVILTEVDPARG